jgi:hypothetical protein
MLAAIGMGQDDPTVIAAGTHAIGAIWLITMPLAAIFAHRR